IKLSNRSSLLTINAVNIGFIDERDYKSRCCNCNVDLQSYLEISKIDLPIIMGYEEAEYLGYGIISSARYEDKIFKIRLPIEYLYLEPTDILVINFLGQEYKLRITDLVVKNMEIKITAVTF
ncbi:MAG: hypothetical protein KA998_01105, partial [Rickettsiaceae bacterium]|nr:hypothetical protein [Rickettsiaceae bacterium]